MLGCTAALPSVVTGFTAVVAVTSAAGLFVLATSALMLGKCAVFRLKISALSALWSLSRLPQAALATVVSLLVLLMVAITAVLTISVADATRVYRICSCNRRRRAVLSHKSLLKQTARIKLLQSVSWVTLAVRVREIVHRADLE